MRADAPLTSQRMVMRVLRRTSLRAFVLGGTCALMTAGAVSTGLAAETGRSGARAGSITLYSGQHEQTVSKLVADFEKRTGVNVAVRSADEATLANQIIQEGSRSPADVFFAENPPALQALAERKLLAPVPAATLKAVPRARQLALGTPGSRVSARSAVLVYNTGKIKPGDAAELAARPRQAQVEGQGRDRPGRDRLPAAGHLDRAAARQASAAMAWLKALKSNAKVYDDNELIVAAVNKGEVATGLVDHYYWYRLRDEVGPSNTKSALHYFAPRDPGMLVDVSGAAILQSSKHAAEARRFLAYLVGKPAQTIIATSESYEYPLGPGVTTTKIDRPLCRPRPGQGQRDAARRRQGRARDAAAGRAALAR